MLRKGLDNGPEELSEAQTKLNREFGGGGGSSEDNSLVYVILYMHNTY